MASASATIPVGYKQTEVGVIPEDWEVMPFDSVIIRINTKRFQIQTSDYLDSGMHPIVDQGQKYVVGYSNQSDRVFPCPPEGVIIFGDHTCIVKFVDFDFVVGADGTQILDTCKNICTHFIAYQLENRGVAQGGYNRHFKILKEKKFVIPDFSEQEAIVDALSDSDSQIQALANLIVKKRGIKQGTMQELLTGETRLPGFSGEWNSTNLLNLVDSSRGIRYGIVQPGNFDQNGRYMIRGQDYSFAKGWATPSEIFKVSDEVEIKYKKARVKTGDLIMTIVGYCGHVEEIPEWLDGANLTQTTARIAIHPAKANSRYCRYALMSEFCQRQVGYFTKAAAQPGLNCGDVEKFVLQMPPSIKEQEAIAEILSDMDAEITALEQRLEKTKAIKQGMMQQLLTGRIRLVDPSTPVEASA